MAVATNHGNASLDQTFLTLTHVYTRQTSNFLSKIAPSLRVCFFINNFIFYLSPFFLPLYQFVLCPYNLLIYSLFALHNIFLLSLSLSLSKYIFLCSFSFACFFYGNRIIIKGRNNIIIKRRPTVPKELAIRQFLRIFFNITMTQSILKTHPFNFDRQEFFLQWKKLPVEGTKTPRL